MDNKSKVAEKLMTTKEHLKICLQKCLKGIKGNNYNKDKILHRTVTPITCANKMKSTCCCSTNVRGQQYLRVETEKNLLHTMIFSAIQYNNSNMLTDILDNYETDVNELNQDGIGAMHFASIVDSSQCTRILIKYGACVNKEDIRGRTPVHYAALMESKTTLRLLEQFNAV